MTNKEKLEMLAEILEVCHRPNVSVGTIRGHVQALSDNAWDRYCDEHPELDSVIQGLENRGRQDTMDGFSGVVEDDPEVELQKMEDAISEKIARDEEWAYQNEEVTGNEYEDEKL